MRARYTIDALYRYVPPSAASDSLRRLPIDQLYSARAISGGRPYDPISFRPSIKSPPAEIVLAAFTEVAVNSEWQLDTGINFLAASCRRSASRSRDDHHDDHEFINCEPAKDVVVRP